MCVQYNLLEVVLVNFSSLTANFAPKSPVYRGFTRALGISGAENTLEVCGYYPVLIWNNAPLDEYSIVVLPCRGWKLCSHSCEETSAPS